MANATREQYELEMEHVFLADASPKIKTVVIKINHTYITSFAMIHCMSFRLSRTAFIADMALLGVVCMCS